jgi:hypothetical protein
VQAGPLASTPCGAHPGRRDPHIDDNARRDHLDLLQPPEPALQGSLRSLEPSLKVAIRAPANANADADADADADVALRMRRERASAPTPGDATLARREAPLEFTTVMAQVTELVFVQDDEARRMVRDRLAGGEAGAGASGRDRA